MSKKYLPNHLDKRLPVMSGLPNVLLICCALPPLIITELVNWDSVDLVMISRWSEQSRYHGNTSKLCSQRAYHTMYSYTFTCNRNPIVSIGSCDCQFKSDDCWSVNWQRRWRYDDFTYSSGLWRCASLHGSMGIQNCWCHVTKKARQTCTAYQPYK